ncbi:MAG: toprim domain-containing protein [Methylothermaceae bacterium]|nr:toprim domain-containing protein [Methylothermaceae bacterium]
MSTNRNQLESEDVRRQARGRWRHILGQLAPELEKALKRPGKHVPCPIHGGTDGFRLFRDVADTGGGICNSCGARPDGFALLQWLKGWSFPETLEAVAGVAGHANPSRIPEPAVRKPEKPVSDAERAKIAGRLRRIWKGSVPVTDPAAAPLRRYLRRRGLNPEAASGFKDLRFHPALPYFEAGRIQGRYPAMLALMRDRNGYPVAVHRTYLTPSGRKAPVASPRKLTTPIPGREITGGAVRLGTSGLFLGIAEGIETALAVHQVTGMPVWPTLSRTFLARFDPPPGVETVMIWADRDRSGGGLQSAQRLRDRRKGIKTYILAPAFPIPKGRKGLDWLDVLNNKGAAGFPLWKASRTAA